MSHEQRAAYPLVMILAFANQHLAKRCPGFVRRTIPEVH